MSRTSLLAGMIAAVVLHALLWVSREAPADNRPPDRKAVAITPPPPIPEAKPEPQPDPEPEEAPEPTPQPAPQRESQPQVRPKPPAPPADPEPAPPSKPLQEVVEAPRTPPADQAGDTGLQSDADGDLPRLRIVWRSSGELQAVAAQLGLRIVAVNTRGEILGEVAGTPARLDDFDGDLGHYSNRVRTLPSSFFGRDVAEAASQPIDRFWVLVPAAIDRRWIALQKRALAAKGLDADGVREVEGAFGFSSGRYRLTVTRIRPDTR